jgi:hypothetical protein
MGLLLALSAHCRGRIKKPPQAIRHRRRGGRARRRWLFRLQRAAFRKQNDAVGLVAFDVLALEGDDPRRLPLAVRKNNLQRLLARRPDGIFFSDYEQGEIGPELFRKICEFMWEGIVSKRRDRPYKRSVTPSDQGEEPAASRV